VKILDMRQYRIRNASLDEAEALLVEFGRKAAGQIRLQHTLGLARTIARNIDAVALGRDEEAPCLDALRHDLHQDLLDLSSKPVEDDMASDRVVFDLYPLRGDVLLRNAINRFPFRRLLSLEPRIERDGRAVIPYDQAEYDRREADWKSVGEARRVVAFDGIIDLPDLHAIRLCVPNLDRRASSAATNEVHRQEVARLMQLDYGPDEVDAASIRAEEYLDTDEGMAEVEKVRLEMLEKLPPKITDDMLINGVTAAQVRTS